MRSREDLLPGEPKIEAFLTDLAVHGNVAPATQNQATFLVILYRQLKKYPFALGCHSRESGNPEVMVSVAPPTIPRRSLILNKLDCRLNIRE